MTRRFENVSQNATWIPNCRFPCPQIGTGFSDEDFQKHTEFFKDHVIESPRSYYRYDKSHNPDHWFDSVQVWEIKCADLSLSPVHRAAIGIVSGFFSNLFDSTLKRIKLKLSGRFLEIFSKKVFLKRLSYFYSCHTRWIRNEVFRLDSPASCAYETIKL